MLIPIDTQSIRLAVFFISPARRIMRLMIELWKSIVESIRGKGEMSILRVRGYKKLRVPIQRIEKVEFH